MNSCELVTFVSSVACAISKSFSSEETALLSAVFTQLGDSLETILAYNDFCEPGEEEYN